MQHRWVWNWFSARLPNAKGQRGDKTMFRASQIHLGLDFRSGYLQREKPTEGASACWEIFVSAQFFFFFLNPYR